MLKKITLSVFGLLLAACTLVINIDPRPAQPPPLSPTEGGQVTARNVAPVQSTYLSSDIAAGEQHITAPINVPIAHSPYIETKVDDTVIVADGKSYPLRTYRMALVPNDPSGTQWWTTSTGLPTAWDYERASTTKIAIIDSGFALDHEEFAGRWLERPGEKGATVNEAPNDLNCTDAGLPLTAACNNIDDDVDGINDNEVGPATDQNPSRRNCTGRGLPLDKSCNLIDDDDNGFADDWRGWDFISGDAYVQAGEINPDGEGAGHGTSVAGVAAASGNNGVGIAGVNWSAKILPLQALADDGYGDTLSVARAIRYAADQGVDVINLSLGSSQEDTYLRSAIAYALGKGAVVVAAAGNEGCNCISYPANYPEVVAVGAQRSDGTVAPFSNTGANLDITAPGSGMFLPIWVKTNETKAYAGNLAGTSFSSPYVSGLLASARSKQPNATWGQLIGMLQQTSDRRSLTAATPYSESFGAGFARAGHYMLRSVNVYQQPVRYAFATETSNVLGAPTAGDCEPGQLPAVSLYQIASGNSIMYSTSELTAVIQRAAGAIISRRAYQCVSLPTDRYTMMHRVMNPQLELSNAAYKP